MTIVLDRQDVALRSLTADWTYERWEQLLDDGNRYEVIDGVLYVTTSPSNFHQWIVSRLVRVLGNPLEDQGWGYAFSAPIGVLMPGCDPAQPDFLLIRRSNASIIADRRIRGVPDFTAEVVSPGSVEQDTKIKRRAYANAGVPEYWIIRPETRDVLVRSDPDPVLGDYTQTQLVREGAQLAAATLPTRVHVSDLFADAPDVTI